jgi:DNA polymerase III subunit beta
MNLTVERDILAEVFGTVSSLARGAGRIEILKHCLLDAADNQLRIFAHNLESCCEAIVPAEIKESGQCVVPAEQLRGLLGSFAKGAQVSLAQTGRQIQVSCGRARLKLPVMDVNEFPLPLAINDSPLSIGLTAPEIVKLFSAPRTVTFPAGTGRDYLAGVFFHRDAEGNIAGAGANGVGLIKISLEKKAPPEHAGVIIPNESVDVFLKLIGEDGAALQLCGTTARLIASRYTFTTKLIDGCFPDYARLLTPTNLPPLRVDRESLARALDRLRFVNDGKGAAELSWPDDARTLAITLARHEFGSEDIDCEGVAAGSVIVKPVDFSVLLAGIKSEMIDIHCGNRAENPQAPIRITAPNDPSVVALIAPCVF